MGPGEAVVVVGRGLAGLGAVRALRSLGYGGRIVQVADESHQPYDRPPLSKAFLAGTLPVEGLALAAPQDADLDVEVRAGTTAVALDPVARTVRLASGEWVGGDGVVVASGARARRLPGRVLLGVHTLRSLDDALALRDDLVPGARLVVIGAGFIGAEVAATASALGVEVTVVEAADVPLAGPLGVRFGAFCARLHRNHGVRLITGTGVAALLSTEGATPPQDAGRVRGVALADGRELPADVVLVAVGSRPNVEWLADSGLDVTGGVRTDADGATGVPGVVATGDCTRRIEPGLGTVVRQEHWTNALHHPQRAVAALLGVPPPAQPVHAAVPYFWSDQYGAHLQFAGTRRDGDQEEIVEGSPDDGSFVGVYRREGRVVAVLGVDSPRSFSRWRRQLATARDT